jgi:hypothetical protein
MALVLTEEQSMLRDSARGLIGDKAPVSHLRQLRDAKDATGFSRDLWKAFAEIGFAGLLVPENFGGSGLGCVEAGVVMEEIGRTLMPSPFLSTAVLAASALSPRPRCRAAAARRRSLSICRRFPMVRCWPRLRSTRAPSIARFRFTCRRCDPATGSGLMAPRRSWSMATPPIS